MESRNNLISCCVLLQHLPWRQAKLLLSEDLHSESITFHVEHFSCRTQLSRTHWPTPPSTVLVGAEFCCGRTLLRRVLHYHCHLQGTRQVLNSSDHAIASVLVSAVDRWKPSNSKGSASFFAVHVSLASNLAQIKYSILSFSTDACRRPMSGHCPTSIFRHPRTASPLLPRLGDRGVVLQYGDCGAAQIQSAVRSLVTKMVNTVNRTVHGTRKVRGVCG